VNPRVAKGAFGLLVNSKPKQQQQQQNGLAEESSDPPVKARATPRALLQKRATMQLLLPLLEESGFASESGSMKTLSDVADAALLALWLQRARAAAVAAADHAGFAAAFPAAAAEISGPLLQQVCDNARQLHSLELCVGCSSVTRDRSLGIWVGGWLQQRTCWSQHQVM